MGSKIHSGGVLGGQAEKKTFFNASRTPQGPLLGNHLGGQNRSKPVQEVLPRRSCFRNTFWKSFDLPIPFCKASLFCWLQALLLSQKVIHIYCRQKLPSVCGSLLCAWVFLWQACSLATPISSGKSLLFPLQFQLFPSLTLSSPMSRSVLPRAQIRP